MTIRHHLSDALLLAYSAGQLPEAFSLIAAAHISMCDDCRARAGSYDAVGGAMVESGAVAPLSEGCLAATMARIAGLEQDPKPTAPRPNSPRQPSILPAPVRDYVGGDLAQVRWRPLGMGVRQAILPTARDASARLLYIPAGRAMPDHGHRGTELTLVLQGAFADESDHFGPGDLEIADQSMDHTPVAAPGADCICLAATDAPLRFNTLIPRLVQPFFRI
jgi:putative transcriptional regulator